MNNFGTDHAGYSAAKQRATMAPRDARHRYIQFQKWRALNKSKSARKNPLSSAATRAWDQIYELDHQLLERSGRAFVAPKLRTIYWKWLRPFSIGNSIIPLLRPRRQRPRGRRATEQRDELASPHSITSSARASSVGGTSRPSALAVLRFRMSSNFVGCMTGRSAGLAPERILPT